MNPGGHIDTAWLVGRLRGQSDRKLRLVACGLCRAIWDELSAGARHAVAFAEEYADGHGPDATRQDYFARLRAEGGSHAGRRERWLPACTVVETGRAAAEFAIGSGVPVGTEVGLLRDLFATAFRPVALDPGWLTADVLALARGVYDERAFDRLPILADALQDAGCNNPDVLDHCRSGGPHARGCWVVDLVLGKT